MKREVTDWRNGLRNGIHYLNRGIRKAPDRYLAEKHVSRRLRTMVRGIVGVHVKAPTLHRYLRKCFDPAQFPVCFPSSASTG